MEPTHEEKEKYEALCEEYGEEESIAGLLNYVKATRGSISAASPTHIGEGAQRGAMFDAPSRNRARAKKGASQRVRGPMKPHERAVRTAIRNVTCEYHSPLVFLEVNSRLERERSSISLFSFLEDDRAGF